MSVLPDAVIAWNGGGEGAVVSASGVQVVLRSTKPFPPGAPVAGTLAANTEQHAFTAKVAGSRKVDEGVWEVRARLVSATSGVIAAFAAAAPRA